MKEKKILNLLKKRIERSRIPVSIAKATRLVKEDRFKMFISQY